MLKITLSKKIIEKEKIKMFKEEIFKDLHQEINYFLGEIFDDYTEILNINKEEENTLTDIFDQNRANFIYKSKRIFCELYFL